jgi:HEAT repeat protein
LKKRLFIGLVVLGVCVLAGVLAIRRSRPDTLFQGKTIKAWAWQLLSPTSAVREEAAAVFRGLGTNAVPGLIALLDSRDPLWRRQLWRYGFRLPMKYRSRLLRQSSVPNEETIHLAAAMALEVIGPDGKAAAPSLGRVLRSGEREPRAHVATALGCIGKDSLPILLDALRDPDPDVRRMAMGGLAGLGPAAEPAIPVLIEKLKDQDVEMRTKAIGCLGSIGPRAVPALVRAIEQEKGLVRQGAAKALTFVGASRSLAEPALWRMVRDEEAASRQQAIATLTAIHSHEEPTITAMTAALKDPSPEVRVAAAKGLGELRWMAQPAVSALVEALKDESPALRSSAAKTLGRIGAPAKVALPELTRLSEEDPDSSVRAAAKDALARTQAGQGK